MKTISLLFIISLFIYGVVSDESLYVYEGDSVTLHINTDTQRANLIEWRFGDQHHLIAKINREANLLRIFDDVLDGRFRDRLQVNNQTGDLIITNTTTQHTGDYQLEIIREKITKMTFIISVVGDKVKTEIVGDSVIVVNNIIKKPGDEKLVFRIQHKKSPVAEIIRNGTVLTYNVYDGKFRDRLQVNDQTDDLTITNIRPDDSGSYEVDITVGSHIYTIHRSFNVPVKEPRGMSPGAATGISVFFILLITAAAAAAVVFYYRRKISKPIKLLGETEELPHTTYEGESVDLKTKVTDIQRVEKIEWKFGDKETLIAEINPDNNIFSTYDGDDDLFKDKLKLNPQTGDLTINDIRLKHNGVYLLKIIRDGETTYRKFNVFIKCERGEEEFTTARSSLNRDTSLDDIQGVDPMEGRFGEAPIAKINPAENIFSASDADLFRDKLKLNPQTGDVTNNDFREKHIGDGETSDKRSAVSLITSRGGDSVEEERRVSGKDKRCIEEESKSRREEERKRRREEESKRRREEERRNIKEKRQRGREEKIQSKRGGDSVGIEMPLLPNSSQ